MSTRVFNKMLKLCLLMIGITFSYQSLAACAFTAGKTKNSTVVTLPANLTLGRDSPAGTILWDSAWISGGATEVKCTGADSATLGYASAMTLAPGYTDVYKTSNDSIGIRTYFSNSLNTAFQQTVYYPVKTSYFNSGVGMNYTPDSSYRVQLISLGNLTSGTLAFASPTAQLIYAGVVTNELAFSSANINIKASSCTVNTSSFQITLEDVVGSNLNAIGTTAKPKPFNVGLTCTEGTKINAQLIGEQNTDSSAVGVLKLTNAGSAGVATGVGIQILADSTPMPLNENIVLKTSPGGLETLPFTARYYQTKATVTSGSANATATLEITYQ